VSSSASRSARAVVNQPAPSDLRRADREPSTPDNLGSGSCSCSNRINRAGTTGCDGDARTARMGRQDAPPRDRRSNDGPAWPADERPRVDYASVVARFKASCCLKAVRPQPPFAKRPPRPPPATMNRPDRECSYSASMIGPLDLGVLASATTTSTSLVVKVYFKTTESPTNGKEVNGVRAKLAANPPRQVGDAGHGPKRAWAQMRKKNPEPLPGLDACPTTPLGPGADRATEARGGHRQDRRKTLATEATRRARRSNYGKKDGPTSC